MKQIFAFVGSRNDQSTLTQYISKMLKQLNHSDEYIINFHTPNNTIIYQSTGCKNCFNNGVCEQDKIQEDNMEIVKQNLLKADFVIFASPVYSHNVSGDMKAFMDRIAYWGHLFRLAGKPGMVFASGTNGLNFVLDYQEKILNYLGVITVDRVSLIPSPTLEDNMAINVDNIKSYATGLKQVTSNETTEAAFLSFKYLFSSYSKDHAEYKYWDRSGLFNCDNFQEFLDTCVEVKV